MGSSRMESTTVYLERDQLARLRVLYSKTKVPMAEIIREGVDRVLEECFDGERFARPPVFTCQSS